MFNTSYLSHLNFHDFSTTVEFLLPAVFLYFKRVDSHGPRSELDISPSFAHADEFHYMGFHLTEQLCHAWWSDLR